LRRLREMSQSELAERIGTKQPGIARLEAGDANPRLSTLVSLAEALHATIRVQLEPVETSFRALLPAWWDVQRPVYDVGGTWLCHLAFSQDNRSTYRAEIEPTEPLPSIAHAPVHYRLRVEAASHLTASIEAEYIGG
jgi:transcriptional regulator with XRE-family HTH domain